LQRPEKKEEHVLEVTPGKQKTHVETTITVKGMTLPKPVFTCHCGEMFDRHVWHCAVCDHHWPMERTECWNCHEQDAPKKPDTREVD